MATQIELLQEANRRGILPPEKVALLQEAINRGLVSGEAGQQPQELSGIQNIASKVFGVTQQLASGEPLRQVGEAALELGPGLGELAAGGFQRGAELLGREDISKRIGQQVAQERAGLTTAQKVGRGVGQVIGTAPAGAVGGLFKGAALGSAAISALTPTEEGTLEAAGKQIFTGTLTGLATAGTIKGIGGASIKAKQFATESIKRVKAGLGARTVEQLETGTIALKTKSSELYEQMRNIGADINKKAATKLATDLDRALIRSGKINQKLHGDTVSVVKDIRADAKIGRIDLEGLDQHRQNLSAVVKKNTDNISGQVNADGQKATVLIDKLDDLIEGLSSADLGTSGVQARQLLTEARKDWKIFSKFQRISNLAERADGDPNRIKAIFQQFVSKKKNLRGFTVDEKKALKFAAQNTGGEKLLKSLGKFGFDFGASATAGNTALPVFSIFAGGVSGSPIGGLALTASGTVARQAQKLFARGKIDDALTLIQQGGNVAEVISKIPNKKAQQELLTRLLAVSAAGANIQQ